MPDIPLDNKIHTVAAGVNTENKGSAQANAGREAFTIQDLADTIGGDDTNLGNSNLVQTEESRSYTMDDNTQSLSFFSTFADPVLKINANPPTVDVFGDIRLGQSLSPTTRYLTISVDPLIVTEASYEIQLPSAAPSDNQHLSVLAISGDVSVMNWTDPASKVNFGTAPATSGSTGAAGDVVWTADYIYVCTAANTWKRVAIATW